MSNDTSFFLLVPTRQSPVQFLEAALHPNRVARLMRRFCYLLLLQQQQAGARMQQQLQQQLDQVQEQLLQLLPCEQQLLKGFCSFPVYVEPFSFSFPIEFSRR